MKKRSEARQDLMVAKQDLHEKMRAYLRTSEAMGLLFHNEDTCWAEVEKAREAMCGRRLDVARIEAEAKRLRDLASLALSRAYEAQSEGDEKSAERHSKVASDYEREADALLS